jgi:D-erythro-7,8-dihydroneopterin triphosphate epimerase
MRSATIRITDLLVRTIIGGNEWERNAPQDVIINVEFSYDASKAIASDSLEDSVDYKKMKRRIIEEVEQSHYRLLETLANRVLSLAMEDERIQSFWVRVEKPGALRFAKTVSAEMSERRLQ